MDRLKTTLITAFVIAILFAPTVSAQAVAANVAIVSGSGQLICPGCAGLTFTFFYPMVVKVTDVNGRPIGGKEVDWQVIGPPQGVQAPTVDPTSFTDSNGLAYSRIFPGIQTSAGFARFAQTIISATVDGATANFTETQALVDPANFTQVVFANLVTPFGTMVTGPAGSTGTTPIQIHVEGRGTPVPNVSLRLLSPDPTAFPNAPSASCVTGPGADPGSVLTDANGNASCFPVFGPAAGSGQISVLVGGLDPAEFDQSISPRPLTDAISFFTALNAIQIVVTPVTPGLMTIVSGNNQSVNPGQTSAPLVAKVTDASGIVTIANTTVTWTVSPAGLATVTPALTTTDSVGQAQTTVTFAPNASGSITVRAALTGSNNGIGANFVLTTRVTIASLTKVSGDLQTAQSGQNFATPLIVQVNGTNGLPVSNQPISFVVNGSATISANSVLTDANGQAKVTVTAGATAGTVTVSAFIGNLSQVFTLTVIPPGPALSNNSFYNAGGASKIAALSPCSLVTVLTTGLAPNVQGMVLNTNAFGPWATTLASDTVTVNNVAAPIYSVGNVNSVEQLTFQVPCETAPANSVPITINVAGGSATVTFPVVPASPGIFETVMSDGARRAVVIRPDGTFVSLQNPARRGEVVRAFVTGMGPAGPPIVTNALPVPGTDSLALGQVIVGVNNAGTRVVTARVAPSLIGVFEIAFQIPSDAPTGSDVVLSVAINAPNDNQTRFSNGSKLPIQ
jgi:uncharacterized protein (TIGR03437 family)